MGSRDLDNNWCSSSCYPSKGKAVADREADKAVDRGEGKEVDRAAGSRKNCRKNHSCSPKS